MEIIIEIPLLKNRENHPCVIAALNGFDKQIAKAKKKKCPSLRFMQQRRDDILDCLFAEWSEAHKEEYYEKTPFRTGDVEK